MRSQDAEFGLMQKTMLAAIVHAGTEPPYCTPPVEDRVRVVRYRTLVKGPTALAADCPVLRKLLLEAGQEAQGEQRSELMSDPQCRSDTLGSGSEWVDGRWILILQ